MTSALELAANVVITMSILLAGRNNLHTWWTGMLGCVLFGVLFTQSRLYADATLQGFFIVTGVIGWWQWSRGRDGAQLEISRIQMGDLAWAMLIGAAATAAYGTLLHRFSDAYAPFVDSAVLVFSVIAQCLMVRRKVEAWPVWLLVNTISVPLYCARGLYLTAFLYGCYWINAMFAWRRWSQQVREPAYADRR